MEVEVCVAMPGIGLPLRICPPIQAKTMADAMRTMKALE
jgi:hypothetical protein